MLREKEPGDIVHCGSCRHSHLLTSGPGQWGDEDILYLRAGCSAAITSASTLKQLLQQIKKCIVDYNGSLTARKGNSRECPEIVN